MDCFYGTLCNLENQVCFASLGSIFLNVWLCSWWFGICIWFYLQYVWQGGIIKLKNCIAGSWRAECSFCDNHLPSICLLFVKGKGIAKLGNQEGTSWVGSFSGKPLFPNNPVENKRNNVLSSARVLSFPFLTFSCLEATVQEWMHCNDTQTHASAKLEINIVWYWKFPEGSRSKFLNLCF